MEKLWFYTTTNEMGMWLCGTIELRYLENIDVAIQSQLHH